MAISILKIINFCQTDMKLMARGAEHLEASDLFTFKQDGSYFSGHVLGSQRSITHEVSVSF